MRLCGRRTSQKSPNGALETYQRRERQILPEKELREEVHYYKGEEQFTFIVDGDRFHHHDEEEARAYLCITRAQYKYAKARI